MIAVARRSPVRTFVDRFRILGPSVPIGRKERAVWLMVSVLCLAVLTLSAWLTPDPRGYGTHEALGMPPCSFILISGLPCPTCGMTSAFAAMMHGRPLAAFIAQPAGAILCLGAMVLMVASFVFAFSGRAVWIHWDAIGPVRLSLGIALLLLGGWAFKVAHGLLSGRLPVH